MAKSRLSRCIDFIRSYPLAFIIVALAAGFISISMVEEVDVYFSSNKFCAGSCHEMESTVYKEYQQSAH